MQIKSQNIQHCEIFHLVDFQFNTFLGAQNRVGRSNDVIFEPIFKAPQQRIANLLPFGGIRLAWIHGEFSCFKFFEFLH